MAIDDPTADELRAAAAELGLDLDDAECASYLALIAPNVAAYRVVDELADPLPGPPAGDRRWWEPPGEDNPLNAWYVRTRIRDETAGEGRLAGRTVAVKDNVCVAGVPMTNGTSILRGYGLPVGMMLVGRHWDESTLYRIAHAFEQSGDWTGR